MPASNQLMSWDLIAAEVAAGRMVWNGASQSGNFAIFWANFTSHVLYDGTNPGGYANNACPPYSYMLARAIVILPPNTITATNAGIHTAKVDWTAPTSGLTPTSYKVEWYQNGILKQTTTGITGLTNTSSTGFVSYTTGDSVEARVYSVNGTQTSDYASAGFTF